MLPSIVPTPPSEIIYPESDGLPMADNSRQFWWIYVFAGNLAALFRAREDVFVCGNQFWYPVQGEPEIRLAPDVYVVFGRPKGHRPSYRQWEEDNVPMTVVFEVLSPNNTDTEMADKLAFYDAHGAEEYYIYDPDNNRLHGYLRSGAVLLRIRGMDGFASPRLGIRFDLSGPELVVRYPDGRPFLTFEELEDQRQEAQRQLGESARLLGESERRAEQTARQLEETARRAEQAEGRFKQAEQRGVRLAELSLKVLRQQATPEDVLELQRLLENVSPPTL